MSLEIIKNKIKCGQYEDARKLIEAETTSKLMNESRTNLNHDFPLLVMLSLIKNEDAAINLSRLLLEKGYSLNMSDRNGLCALNYAIALKRIRLLTVYLDSFNFDLNRHHDIFENSFLHYVYALNDKEITKKFSHVYSKYYEWDPSKFSNIANCDGISVQDLVDYFKNTEHKTRRQSQADNQYSFFFKLDSNPIVICKFINKIFYSRSTFKSDTAFVLNNMNNNSTANGCGVGAMGLLTKRKMNSTANMNASFSSSSNSSGGGGATAGASSYVNQNAQQKKDFKLYILNNFNSLNKPTFGLNLNK